MVRYDASVLAVRRSFLPARSMYKTIVYNSKLHISCKNQRSQHDESKVGH